MALEGSLKDFGLADIFQLIGLQKKTGILTMKNASMEAKVLFENGSVVTADTADVEGLEKIGEILVRSGHISQDQLKQAIANQRQNHKKTGIILVEMGAVKKDDLVNALGLRVKETVLSLFKWREGRYRFEPSDIQYERDYSPLLNTEFIVMEGVRRLDEWPYIEKTVPNFDLIFDKNQEKAAENIQITPEEMRVYQLVDGLKDVRELIDLSQLGEFETCKALSSLLTAGLIHQRNAAEAPIMESDGIAGVKIKSLQKAGRLISKGLIAIVCLVLFGLSIQAVLHEIRSAGDFRMGYQNLMQQNRRDQIRFSVMTYYYRNQHLPDSLEKLVKEGYISERLVSAQGSGEVLYEPRNDSLSFHLTLKASRTAH